MDQHDDIFKQYLSLYTDSEVPAVFHRWSLIAGIGALLGRQYWLTHGQFSLYPNIYCMLLGTPGTRKSTAIKTMKKHLVDSGYKTIAASKTTKEKFLMDLAGVISEPESDRYSHGNKRSKQADYNANIDAILDENLWGSDGDSVISGPDREIFIMADEFNDFFGNGNIEFISLLGTLWDWQGVYTSRTKHSKDLYINNPTVSILGGNTPTGFNLAFPPEAIGQGFFSRVLLIYGEPNGKRFAFPSIPTAESTGNFISALRAIKQRAVGESTFCSDGKTLLERIYSKYSGIDDQRFASYSNRRFSHLLKLCLVCSAARLSTEISSCDVLYANTILSHAEQYMPKAIGEFGKSRNSDVTHRILDFLSSAGRVVTFKEIWKIVASDLETQEQLSLMLFNLGAADKISKVDKGSLRGFLPKKQRLEEEADGMVDYSLLTEEERNMTK